MSFNSNQIQEIKTISETLQLYNIEDFSSILINDNDKVRLNEEKLINSVKNIISYIQNLHIKLSETNEKLLMIYKEKRQMEDKFQKIENELRQQTKKNAQLEKTILNNKDQQKDEIDKLKAKQVLIEGKVKVYQQRESQFQSEIIKKEKEICDLKEEMKKALKNTLVKQGLEPFEYIFSKGITLSYGLMMNKTIKIGSLEEGLNELLEANKKTIHNTMLMLDNQLKNVLKIVSIIDNVLKEVFVYMRIRLINRLSEGNLYINSNYEVNEIVKGKYDKDDNGLESIAYEDNDYEYDLQNNRIENIVISIGNNIEKIKLLHDLNIRTYDIKSKSMEELQQIVKSKSSIIEVYKISLNEIFNIIKLFTSSRKMSSKENKIDNKEYKDMLLICSKVQSGIESIIKEGKYDKNEYSNLSKRLFQIEGRIKNDEIGVSIEKGYVSELKTRIDNDDNDFLKEIQKIDELIRKYENKRICIDC